MTRASTLAALIGLMTLLLACAPAAEQMDADATDASEMTEDMGDMQAMLDQGQQVYAESCAGCHGPEGLGNVGPAHAGNANLADADFVIVRLLDGQGQMPAWRDRLDDEQIAAVASYIRNSFGNSFGPVSAAQVGAAR